MSADAVQKTVVGGRLELESQAAVGCPPWVLTTELRSWKEQEYW